MKKKLLALGSISAVVLGAAAIVAGGKAVSMISAADHSESCVWNHYAGIGATLESNGSKEYWVCCAHHTTALSAPTVGTVNDATHANDAEFLATLEATDSRYIAAYKKHFEFEDNAIHYLSASTNVTGLAIGETSGVEGGACVEVSISNSDYFIDMDSAYLDAVFADASVNALAFDAKATTVTSNFRNGAAVCFEVNLDGFGLETDWKTFYYTRAMYAARAEGEKFIKGGGLTSSDTLYLDNFRIVNSNVKPINKVSFDEGRLIHDGNNHTIRQATSASDSRQVCLVSGAGAASVALDSQYTTSGTRALHITKQSGYIAIYASANFYNSLPDEGMFFDLYTKDLDIALYGNDNAKFQWLNTWGNPKNGWVTYHLAKSAIGTDGRFLILQGSPAGDIWIDNIRAADTAMGFETSHATWESSYGYATGHKMEDVSNKGTLCRDTYRNYQFFANGNVVTSATIDDEHVSEGLYSFKVTTNAKGYCALFMSIPFIKANWERGIKMDVYSEGVTFTGGSSMAGVTSGKWVTITLTKDNFETTTIGGVSGMPNGRFFVQNANSAGSFWVDNIRAA